MRLAKTRKNDDETRAMAAFVSMFNAIEDAIAFEKAMLSTSNTHLPPIARVVRDGGQRSALYWRWRTINAEVWS
jgi:hypothetical protein